jgi:hypothetical protein
VTELHALCQAAQAALETAQNTTTRTPVATAKCREAFRVLSSAMRDTKRRYFLTPPLQHADYVSLGLKAPGGTAVRGKKPSAQVTLKAFFAGRHNLGVEIDYLTGDPSDSANKGYRIWYAVTSPGETPPEKPSDLHRLFFTGRKKAVIRFEYEDSGKTAHFAVQVVNGEKEGPWGPMVRELIP